MVHSNHFLTTTGSSSVLYHTKHLKKQIIKFHRPILLNRLCCWVNLLEQILKYKKIVEKLTILHINVQLNLDKF